MKASPIRAIRRKPIGGSPADLVELRHIGTSREGPVSVQPRTDGTNLIEWATEASDYISELLLRHRGLLFRGFDGTGVDNFSQFVEVTSGGERLPYVDRTTPRTTEGDRVYTSTVHPPDQRIMPHNEGTYWTKWPARLYFACVIPSQTGGETPIGDVRGVLSRIPADIVAEFEARQWRLTRNFNDGFGLRWQDVFQTDQPEEVETYCRANDISFEWKDRGRLRTMQVRPAIREHPVTGERLWFNHAAFFHHTSLEEPIRTALLEEFGETDLPYSTSFGDGTPIPPDVARTVMRAYEAEKVSFPWERGDVMLLDNMTMYHGRESYTGERRIIVAMTDIVDE